MQRKLTSLFTVGSLLFIAASFRLGDAFLLFIVAGEVPGTRAVVPPAGMIIILSLVLIIVLSANFSPTIRTSVIKRR